MHDKRLAKRFTPAGPNLGTNGKGQLRLRQELPKDDHYQAGVVALGSFGHGGSHLPGVNPEHCRDSTQRLQPCYVVTMDGTQAARLQQIAAASARDQVLIAAHERRSDAMEETADKVAALRDAARALDSIGAAYALIGGIAVGIHSGVPRATLDTDMAVLSTVSRDAVIGAMRDAGFLIVGEFEHSANFRHTSGEPVQLAFDASFDQMIARAETMSIANTTIRIIRKDDLIEMKRRAAADPQGRKSKALRDQADVELLLGDVPDPDEGW